MLADPPIVLTVFGCGRRVMEDAEQDGRIGGVMGGEIVGPLAEAEGDTFDQRVGGVRGCGYIVEHGRAKVRDLRGPQVGAVERPTRRHPWMAGGQLGSEVEAFLDVGLSRGQLAANREKTAPGRAAVGHRDGHLVGRRQGEEGPAGGIEAPDQRRVDAMTRDVAVPDDVFDALRGHFDERRIVELAILIGTYNMQNRVLAALQIDLEPK